MKKFLNQNLFLPILLFLILVPCFSLAMEIVEIDYPNYPLPQQSFDIWIGIIFSSLPSFFILFICWIFSPLGIIFILASLAQFLFQQRLIRIIAWIYQGIVFILTIIIGIIIFLSFSLSATIIGLGGAIIIIFCLMIGTIIVQIYWQKKKKQS